MTAPTVGTGANAVSARKNVATESRAREKTRSTWQTTPTRTHRRETRDGGKPLRLDCLTLDLHLAPLIPSFLLLQTPLHLFPSYLLHCRDHGGEPSRLHIVWMVHVLVDSGRVLPGACCIPWPDLLGLTSLHRYACMDRPC